MSPRSCRTYLPLAPSHQQGLVPFPRDPLPFPSTLSQETPPMNRRQKGGMRRRRTLQTWSIGQAEAATPYIRSVLTSLREHHSEWQSRQLDVQRLAARSVRPDRAALIAHRRASEEVDRVADRALEAAEELADLDVFTLDPSAGQALLPFVYEEQLAWYLFDLFD